MIVQPDFLDHWKTQLLINLLDDQAAPLYVIRLWAHCQNRKTHAIPNGNPNVTKAICHALNHDAEKFHSAMLEAGFIEEIDGELIAHGWDDVNSTLLRNWSNGKKGGRPKKKTQPKPKDNPSVTQTEPIRLDKSRVDKNRVDEKSKKKTSTNLEPIISELSESRQESIRLWLKYKAERQERYKPTGLKALIKKWSDVSDAEFALIVEQSMSSNYSGLFELKSNDKKSTTTAKATI